ncbi:MAG: N-acetylglucosamine-6-phosphate deacetylase [Acidimicrobiia bacterium]|nr:N-acetylglucosamine-6-phosphate deacetylase [Acidimicrobiia bacterium]
MPAAPPSDLVIRGGFRPGGAATDQLRIVGGRIADGSGREPAVTHATTIDADGLHVAPGFVDLQVNGGYGIDLATEPESMWELAHLLPRHGVTSFLPTIISSPSAVTDRALAALAERPDDHRGAEPLGLHFEGPMLNPDRAGAHDLGNLVAPDRQLVATWSRNNGVALVTLAPELPGAVEVIEHLMAGGVVVSAGHSTATAGEAAAAFDAGVSMGTHLFNAMSPMGHRAPGLTGAALADERITVGLIVDGVHVDPVVVKVAWRAKGPDRVVLVTDAVAAQGLGPGRHRLGDRTVIADAMGVRTDAGVLAGSALTMDRAVANLVEFTGCTLADALAAATRTPATVIGAIDRGHLGPGAAADVVLLEPDGSAALTICRGHIAHVTDGAAARIAGGR